MKILYSAGNRPSAQNQLIRFLAHNKHTIKVAAFSKSSSEIKQIDWMLDAVYAPQWNRDTTAISKFFGRIGVPHVSQEIITEVLRDVDEYAPDLIVCDGEPVLANIAKALGIELWYCSALHLLDGIQWGKGTLKYINKTDVIKLVLQNLPIPHKYFIYSPFGSLLNGPEIKEGYNWIRPYTDNIEESINDVATLCDNKRKKIISQILCALNFKVELQESMRKSNWCLLDGETSTLSDAIYNKIENICLMPSLNDPETLINATMCELYNVGEDLAQVELLEKYAVLEIEKARDRKKSNYSVNGEYIPTLEEEINKKAEMI